MAAYVRPVAAAVSSVTAGAFSYDFMTMSNARKKEGWSLNGAAVRARNAWPPATEFSIVDLARFRRGGDKAYIAAAGVVWDVTNASSGSFESDEAFAGRDCTLALLRPDGALNRMDGWRDLSDEDKLSLESWTEQFDAKYVRVGVVREWVHNEDYATMQRRFLEENAKRADEVLPSGVQYEVLQKPPKGGRAVDTDNALVEIKYVGRRIDGEIFASSEAEVVTASSVVPGLAEVLLGMREGEKRRVFVPAESGYGSEAKGEVVFPESTLVYEVVLLRLADRPPVEASAGEAEAVPADDAAQKAFLDEAPQKALSQEAVQEVPSEQGPPEASSEGVIEEAPSKDAAQEVPSDDATRQATLEEAPQEALAQETVQEVSSEDAAQPASLDEAPQEALSAEAVQQVLSEQGPPEASYEVSAAEVPEVETPVTPDPPAVQELEPSDGMYWDGELMRPTIDLEAGGWTRAEVLQLNRILAVASRGASAKAHQHGYVIKRVPAAPERPTFLYGAEFERRILQHLDDIGEPLGPAPHYPHAGVIPNALKRFETEARRIGRNPDDRQLNLCMDRCYWDSEGLRVAIKESNGKSTRGCWLRCADTALGTLDTLQQVE